MNFYSALHAIPLLRVDSAPPEGSLVGLISDQKDLKDALEWCKLNALRVACIIADDPHQQYQEKAEGIPVQSMRYLSIMPQITPCYYSQSKEYGPLHRVATALRAHGIQSLYLCRPPLGVAEGHRCVTNFLEQNAQRVRAVYSSLADEESKLTYAARVKALITGNMGYLSLSTFPCYQHPRVPVMSGFTVVDGGCAWGGLDTFARLVGDTGHVWGFEPDGAGYASIVPSANTTVTNCGLWHENTMGLFSCRGSSTCILNEQQETTVQQVPLVRLDDFVRERGIAHVDFIKLDVEGAEVSALKGACETLGAFRPNLALCIYHNNSRDLVDVPEFIRELDLGYIFYVGQHAVNAYDTVLYAVSPQ